MAIRPILNYLGDPFDSDNVPEYLRVQSEYYSGTYSNLYAPDSPNYPVNTPARYFMYLPAVPDSSNLGSRPILIRDVTNSVTLTKVTSSPAANQYALAPSTSKTPHVIELNAAQAGVEIGYDYYTAAAVINEDTTPLYSLIDEVTASSTVASLTISGLSANYDYGYDLEVFVKSSSSQNIKLYVNGVNDIPSLMVRIDYSAGLTFQGTPELGGNIGYQVAGIPSLVLGTIVYDPAESSVRGVFNGTQNSNNLLFNYGLGGSLAFIGKIPGNGAGTVSTDVTSFTVSASMDAGSYFKVYRRRQ